MPDSYVSKTRRGERAIGASSIIACVVLAASSLAGAAYFFSARRDLPPVPIPVENPITESKRILGKILFWDEQLSSDNTTACGTCHIPTSAGADPRLALNPGNDGVPGTPDDVISSFGIVRADALHHFVSDPVFNLAAQATPRSAPSAINAGYANDTFWDGRATSTFTDPQTGFVSIASGGALESQAVGPPLSNAEMGHEGRNWDHVVAKLTPARPLALATDLPPDVAAALASSPSYPDLFAAAFGDGTLTAERIAYAIATYERTLIADQTPWDAFVAGNPNALTPRQAQGWQIFQIAGCNDCHTAPLFTDNEFRNIGLRPINLDTGRQAFTGNPADRGKFKVPSLRNAGLKASYMHSGQFATLRQAINFYVNPSPFQNNIDPLMASVNINPPQVTPVEDFIVNGLTDPRVAAGTFPFDRPTLRSELPANPRLLGSGPLTMVATSPPNAGNSGFALGGAGVPEGASLSLLVSASPPVGGLLNPDQILGPYTATTRTGNQPVATAIIPIPDDPALDGTVVYYQWLRTATGERSPTAEATIFCGTGGCATPCPADLTTSIDPNDPLFGIPDGTLDAIDFFYYLNRFAAGDMDTADLTGSLDPNNPTYGIADGVLDANDFFYYLDLFTAGCP